MTLHPDWKEFIGLLNSHGVEYVVVGAFARAFHGVPRATGDIDIFVRVSATRWRSEGSGLFRPDPAGLRALITDASTRPGDPATSSSRGRRSLLASCSRVAV